MVQLVSLLIPNMLKMEPNVNMLFGMNSFKQMQVFFFFLSLPTQDIWLRLEVQIGTGILKDATKMWTSIRCEAHETKKYHVYERKSE